MAHPGGLLGRKIDEELALLRLQLRLSELGDPRPLDPAAEVLRHQLHPIADPERRHAELEDPRVDLGTILGVDRGGPARENKRERVLRTNGLGRDRVADELRVDAALAHAARDQLRVLPAEIQNQHRPLFGRGFLGRERNDLTHP